MGRKILQLLNGLITFAVTVCLIAAGAYAGYSLWDNQQVYDSAESVFAELKDIRATIQTPTLSAMEQLLEENRQAREAEAAERAAAQETAEATAEPATQTTEAPTAEPTAQTTEAPTAEPTAQTTEAPTAEIRAEANGAQEKEAQTEAAARTTEAPTAEIRAEANKAQEAPEATAEPAAEQNNAATEAQTEEPVAEPTETPTAEPTEAPTAAPSAEPTPEPTAEPTPEPTPDNSPFGQLKQINKDITAWITMPGTAIDYPVLQGTSNYSYINTDVYGNFALAGSIFLDSRNDPEYRDIYSLLYGHNMSQHRMFSDINLYKEKEFFEENRLGLMLLPDGYHILESLCVIVTRASDSGMFNPENWKPLNAEEILKMTQENAMYTCEDGMQALEEQLKRMEDGTGEAPRIVSLSTCSDEFTDARTVLLTLMDP